MRSPKSSHLEEVKPEDIIALQVRQIEFLKMKLEKLESIANNAIDIANANAVLYECATGESIEKIQRIK